MGRHDGAHLLANGFAPRPGEPHRETRERRALGGKDGWIEDQAQCRQITSQKREHPKRLAVELAARNSDVRYSHEQAMGIASIRRSVRALKRRVRETRTFAQSLKHPYRPVVAQI